MQIQHLEPGQLVRVRDGKPQPPARFRRKLAEWNGRNFDGYLVAFDTDPDRATIQKARNYQVVCPADWVQAHPDADAPRARIVGEGVMAEAVLA